MKHMSPHDQSRYVTTMKAIHNEREAIAIHYKLIETLQEILDNIGTEIKGGE